ncbi:MAG: peptidoglycan DD-metalloendopeptidase family protein [Deltaproteobacteria bacterium]|nr:peptidoglycan DD-metalloendopeptidase family protein [Deltaproteobacteria bacterium]
MRKKISFVILGSSGAPAKQVCTSKTAIHLFGVFVIALFAAVGYIVYDYYNLRVTTTHLQNREVYLSSQLDEIQAQRRQIQEFANEINSLKAKLMALNSFEQKIRIIANIEKTDQSANIFGVGGSIPEDLDAQISLKEKHNSLMRDMHEQIDQLSQASSNQQEALESLLKSLEDQQNLLASTPAIRPVARNVKSWITSRFGYRKSPFTQRRELHKGYDIASRQGTPILCTADGVVTFAGKKGLLGKTVVIDHGHGMVTRYGHCSKLLKKRGDKVKRWETIALMGNTGRSTGPHVHYEVHLNGIPVNPVKYILN